MFPFLPALILLLLHGPSCLDDMRPGMWPVVSEAVTIRMWEVPHSANHIDIQAAQAIVALLSKQTNRPSTPVEVDRSTPTIAADPITGDLDGFQQCRRTRDGPFAVA